MIPIQRSVNHTLLKDSAELLTGIKEHYLHPQSTEVTVNAITIIEIQVQGYNETLIKPDPMNMSSYYYSQYGQDAFLEEFIFKGKLKEGFFVEAGAADGVLDSNTLVSQEKMFCYLGRP